MGICLCPNSYNIVRNINNDLINIGLPKNGSELIVPIENNSALSTSQKEIEENINLVNKSNEIKDSLDKRLDSLLEKDNKSVNAEEKSDSEKVNIIYMKSNSMVLKPVTNINIIKANFNIVQEQPSNTFKFFKAKSQKVKNDFNRNNLNLNNLQGHLETVIETISEVFNSKKSKEMSKNKETKSKFFNNNEN